MKLFLIFCSLIVCSFASAFVTNEQCQRGDINDRMQVELQRYLIAWPEPAIIGVEYAYAARLPVVGNGGDYRITMSCCLEAIAEREPNYPDCSVRRTICFDASSFKQTYDSGGRRSINCDTGYP